MTEPVTITLAIFPANATCQILSIEALFLLPLLWLQVHETQIQLQ